MRVKRLSVSYAQFWHVPCYRDLLTGKEYAFLINNFKLSAKTIAVLTQIWIALCLINVVVS